MKFTKENIERIIQEEYENILKEQESILDIIKQTIKGVFAVRFRKRKKRQPKGCKL